MATAKENEKQLLEVTIKELHRLYDNINQSFDELRTRTLALMGGEVAIVAFLFSAGDSQKSLFNKATPIYGIVFYGIGIALLALAFILFLSVISSVTWVHPPEEEDTIDLVDRFRNDPVRLLRHLKTEYWKAINHCASIISPRAAKYKWGIYALSLGTFILLLLKFGGSIIKVGG